MKNKNIVLGSLSIILIVFLAFIIANLIYNYSVSNSKTNDTKPSSDNYVKEYKIDNEVISFKTYRVDQSFFLNVPSDFVMLDENTLKTKYNYNDRPELVFMSSDDTKHIFISTTNDDMIDANLKSYLDTKISTVPNMNVLYKDVYTKFNKTFAKLVGTVDNIYYNFRYFTINNKLVVVEFNIPVSDYEKWENVIDAIMDSICFDEENIKR